MAAINHQQHLQQIAHYNNNADPNCIPEPPPPYSGSSFAILRDQKKCLNRECLAASAPNLPSSTAQLQPSTSSAEFDRQQQQPNSERVVVAGDEEKFAPSIPFYQQQQSGNLLILPPGSELHFR